MKKINIIIFLLLTLLITTACTDNQIISGQAVQEKTYQIGVIAPLTGDAASYGLAAKQGLDFAVSEINSQGGILGHQIKLVYEDSQLDNNQAVSIMNKFINIDKFNIIILADGSGPTTAVAPIADQTKTLIMATLASTPKLSTMGDYVFRTVPSDSYQGKELAKFANNQDFQTAAILYANDAYGIGIKDVFTREFKGKITTSESFKNSETDFRTGLTKIKQYDPDVILLIVRNELPNVLKQIKELNIKSKLLGSETTKNKDLIKKSGTPAEGMYSIYFSDPIDYVGYKTKFKAVYNKDAAGYSDYSYDAIYALNSAVTTTNSFNPERVKDALYSTKIFGATGIVEFDLNGDATNKPFTIYQVRNGQFIKIK